MEGVDDKHVVRHLCEHEQHLPAFDVVDKNGWQNLKSAISSEIKVSGRTALGILVDANQDPMQRWQAIAFQLRQVDLKLPDQMVPGGTIIENRPRVGIWLMPDNGSAGELENFIERLIPAADPIWPRAQCYIDAIPVAERKFAPQKILRAKIHAWLAARAEPRKMGAAVGAGDLNATAPLAIRFTSWLQQLFG